MYRTRPLWYREGLPEILNMFSQIMTTERPGNLHLLSSFATPDFDQDGVHLTPYSGLELVLGLFDGSQTSLERLASDTEVIVSKTSESTRVLEDRVVALEQDHRRLNRVVDDKIAVDSEMSDFLKNERFEDCFVIEGTPRIPDDIVGKPWQDRAVSDVRKVIKLLMGKELRILFVQNATTRQPDAIVAYNVKMFNLADSKAIRDKFGSFFLGGRGDQRPEALKPFSIKNRITPETKIRISILKLLAKRYRDSNPGSKVQVIGYEARPLIKITPAQGASDRRVKVFNYVEAVRALPVNFSPDEINPIIRRINPKLCGQIRSIFIIISDDQYKPRGQTAVARGPVAPNIGSTPSVSASPGSKAGDQSEASEQSEDEEMDTANRSTSDKHSSDKNNTDKSNSERRSKKRGASSSKGGPSKSIKK